MNLYDLQRLERAPGEPAPAKAKVDGHLTSRVDELHWVPSSTSQEGAS